MRLVEQAVFTAQENGPSAGYHVMAKSPGVGEADVRELAAWGPTHDSMLNPSPDAESFNFHPLSSGLYCISRTVPAHWAYGDGTQIAYTQCLLVPLEVLHRFGNNPFAIIQAARAQSVWHVHGSPCAETEPIVLIGGAPPVDQAFLEQLALDPGPENMASLVQMAREASCLAVTGTPWPAHFIAGLFHCLPPECRLMFSFSTGLKFSPRRPFRIITLSGDVAEQRWVEQFPHVSVLECQSNKRQVSRPLDGWARLIEHSLSTDLVPFLASQLSKRRFDLTLDDLPALGLQLLEEVDTSAHWDEMPYEELTTEDFSSSPRRAHAAHKQFAHDSDPPVEAEKMHSTVTASMCLDPGSPELIEKLELLDDLVYDSIGGQSLAMEQLRETWPKLAEELGGELLDESREQYLRYALSIWEESVGPEGIRQPTRAIQALDVLCLLFGDTT
jgi:hypothetical protein